MSGVIGMNTNQVRFKGVNDGNHYIGYTNDNNIDGVRVQGNMGGQLGSPTMTALQWDNNGNIRFKNQQNLKPDADGWLRHHNDAGKHTDRGFATGKLWAEGDTTIGGRLIVNGRDILAELDNKISFAPKGLNDSGPWVQIQSGSDKCVDAGSNNQSCDWNNGWRRFKLIKSGVQRRG